MPIYGILVSVAACAGFLFLLLGLVVAAGAARRQSRAGWLVATTCIVVAFMAFAIAWLLSDVRIPAGG